MKKIFIMLLALYAIKVFALNEYDTLLDKGIDDYNKAQYSFAVNNLAKYVQLSTDNNNKPKAYYYLALSYYFLENYKLSLHYFNELSSKYHYTSHALQSHFWRGLIYQNLKQWFEAEQAFIKFIDALPKSDLLDRAYLALANTEMAQSKFEQAGLHLKTLINTYPKSDKFEEASVLYSYLLIQNKKYDEAEDFLTRWLGKLGKTGGDFQYKDRFWLYRGELAFIKKQYDVARLLFKKIDTYARNSPSADIALLRLSQIESYQGNLRDSSEYLIRLANEYPRSEYNIDASLSMGMTAYDKKDYTRAVDFFNQTIAAIELKTEKMRSQNNSELYQRLLDIKGQALFYNGEINYHQGEYQEAENYYRTIINQGFIRNETALLRLMEVQIKLKKYEELDSLIKKNQMVLIKNEKTRDPFYLVRAQYEFLNEDYPNALNTLNNIKDRNKQHNNILNLRSKIYILQNNYDAAVKDLEELLVTSSFDQKSYIVLELMNLSFKMEDYNQVITQSSMVQTYSQNLAAAEKEKLIIRSEYHKGLSYLQLKEYQKGIETLKNLIAAYQQTSIESAREYISQSSYYLGWLYYKSSQYDEGARAFHETAQYDLPQKMINDAIYMEAWCYFSQKKYQRAITKFAQLKEKLFPDPLAFKAYFQMAKAYENIGKQNEALKIYQEIYHESNIKSYQENALYEIINHRLNKNDVTQAGYDIKEFQKSFPQSKLLPQILMKEGESFIALERYSEALSNFEYIIKKENILGLQNDSIYYWAGYSAYKIKNYHDAKNYLEFLNNKSSSPFFKESMILLITIYREEKNFKKEEAILKELVLFETDNKKVQSYKERLRVLSLIDGGKDEEEARLLSNARSGEPSDLLAMAVYYYNKNKLKESKEYLKKIMNDKKSSEGAQAALLWGNILIDDDIDKALSIYLDVIANYRSDGETKAEALYKASYCYYKKNDRKNFNKIADKLKSSFPQSEWTKRSEQLKQRFK